MKKLRVTVEGRAYEVLVEFLDQDATAAAAPAATATYVATAPAAATPVAVPPPVAARPKASVPTGSDAVVSPLAGKLVSIDVKVGQTVEEGVQVATIEAMKMNTYIYAPKAGRVAEIYEQAGNAVEEGASLLRME